MASTPKDIEKNKIRKRRGNYGSYLSQPELKAPRSTFYQEIARQNNVLDDASNSTEINDYNDPYRPGTSNHYIGRERRQYNYGIEHNIEKDRYYNDHLSQPKLSVPKTTFYRELKKKYKSTCESVECDQYKLPDLPGVTECNIDHESLHILDDVDDTISIEGELTSSSEDDEIKELWDGIQADYIDDLLSHSTTEKNDPLVRFADDDEEENLYDAENNTENIIQEDITSEPESSPVYEGARITLAVSLLLIIKYSMRHSITGVALADLLLLIQVHLPLPNIFGKSIVTLHNFFKKLRNPIEYHYYCTFCYEYIGTKRQDYKHCTNKHCLKDFGTKDSLGYFIVVPLITQLQSLLASKF